MSRALWLATVIGLSGCAHSAASSDTADELDTAILQAGTRHFPSSERLLDRARATLVAAGYEIVDDDPPHWTLLTKRKFSHFAGKTPVYRQYRVSIGAAPDGTFAVTFTPTLFLADVMLTHDDYNLDYERKVWATLFTLM